MEITSIETVDDVKAFIRYLIEHLDLNWHPDDGFVNYVTPSGQPVFTAREAHILEAWLERAFVVCEEVGIDLYELGLEIQLESFPLLRRAA